MNKDLAKYVKNGDSKKYKLAWETLNPEAAKDKDAWKIAWSAAKAGNESTSSVGESGVSGLGGAGTPESGGSFIQGFMDTAKLGLKLVNKTVDVSANVLGGLYKSQLGRDENDDDVEKLFDIAKGGFSMGTVTKILDTAGESITKQLTMQSKIYTDINTKIGISGDLSQGLRDDMIDAQAEAKRYGFTLEDLAGFYTTMSEYSGKFALINKTTLLEAAPVASQLGKTMQELASTISTFEEVGLGADKTIKSMGDAGVRAISLGLSAQKVTKGMEENIGKLNQYGFQGGIKGLERMIQKSVEFRMSMDNIATIADKVINPEGAVELAANLQVLGGAIGSFGDPIKMMYDATNNVEGLQDSLIGAARGLATYNQEQGRFEITGINLRRAREMANSLGISMGDLTKTAVAAQERMAASTALMSSGLNMKDKDKEFLTNLGRMQDGEMKIVVPESLQDKLGKQSEITLSKLTEDQKNVLLANKKAFEEMNPQKMAMAQLTETQQMRKGMDVVATWAKIQAANFLKGGINEAAGRNMAKMRDLINEIDLKSKAKDAQNAGVKVGKLIRKGDYGGAIEKTNDVVMNDLFKTGKKQKEESASTVTKVEQTLTITTDVASDHFGMLAKKNASFGFEYQNPKEFNILTPAKRKGK